MSDVDASNEEKLFRLLCLDGGGSKGFYTLGVLRELEILLGKPLSDHFDLMYGTSTGSIIATLLSMGMDVDAIHTLYKTHVPAVMTPKRPREKSEALKRLATKIFGKHTFEDLKVPLGIVSTKWLNELPMIFKSHASQAHGMVASFVPGFGVPLAEAVQASCSAVPFFEHKIVKTSSGDTIDLIDGGYCANNPTLYAIADAIGPMKVDPSLIRVLSIGVGVYPEPKISWKMWFAKRYVISVELLQKTLEINTQSMDQLRLLLFPNIQTVRVSETFDQPELACDFLEFDMAKLNLLRQQGRSSFGRFETAIKACLRIGTS